MPTPNGMMTKELLRSSSLLVFVKIHNRKTRQDNRRAEKSKVLRRSNRTPYDRSSDTCMLLMSAFSFVSRDLHCYLRQCMQNHWLDLSAATEFGPSADMYFSGNAVYLSVSYGLVWCDVAFHVSPLIPILTRRVPVLHIRHLNMVSRKHHLLIPPSSGNCRGIGVYSGNRTN